MMIDDIQDQTDIQPYPPLGVYRHYKGNLYELIGFAKHSETVEDMVIYKALYSDGGIWVRPLAMWSEIVEVGDNSVRRFEFVGSTMSGITQHDTNNLNTLI